MLPELTFHHIGVATPDIDSTASIYEGAGYTRSATIIDPIQNVKICFLKKYGMPTVELLAPVDDKSPVIKTIEKNGVGPYHCCYATKNMDESISALKKQKYMIVSKPAKACAINDKRVCFLYNKNVGLIELVEE